MRNDNLSVSELLTPEILAQMPKGLVGADAVRWRMNKVNELRSKGVVPSDNTESEEEIPEADTPNEEEIVQETSETIEPTELSENNTETEIFVPNVEENTQSQTSDEKYTSRVKKSVKQSVKKGYERKAASDGYEFIKNMPCDPMNALRRRFPSNASKADLLSAVIYIFTGGDCEISENAMQLVESYKNDDSQFALSERTEERLANIERMLREQRDMLYSVELCTAYNTFDRRYGSKERRTSPKDTEFREKGNLDMLARLRVQAKDQRMIDEVEKGRAIYAQTKDKND